MLSYIVYLGEVASVALTVYTLALMQLPANMHHHHRCHGLYMRLIRNTGCGDSQRLLSATLMLFRQRDGW